jgi:hypothetical protein
MFGMSVKSVPGCLVLIVPRSIGVPVALAPGLVPHDDVPVEALALLLLALDEPPAALLELALVLLLLLLLLPPQPARNRQITAPKARLGRKRSPC